MSTTTFTIEGRGLKLQTADDVKEFIETISGMDALENVILSGNTFGVEACRALAAALAKKPLLKVILPHIPKHEKEENIFQRLSRRGVHECVRERKRGNNQDVLTRVTWVTMATITMAKAHWYLTRREEEGKRRVRRLFVMQGACLLRNKEANEVLPVRK